MKKELSSCKLIAVFLLLTMLLPACTNMYDPDEDDTRELISTESYYDEGSFDKGSADKSSSDKSSVGQSSTDESTVDQSSSSDYSPIKNTTDSSVDWESIFSDALESMRASSESAQPESEFDYDSYDGYHAPDDWTSLYPHGSAGKLEGRVVVVSVFASEGDHVWNYDDDETYKAYSRAYYALKHACEFLTEESSHYGKDVEFIWDWMSCDHLYYVTTLEEDFTDILKNNSAISRAAWRYIESGINSEALRKEYDADSVIYMFYLNSPVGNKQPSCTRDYYRGMPYPYEICYMQMHNSQGLTVPAVFAHEMLHAFGAPDLYWTDTYSVFSLEYGITKEYVEQIQSDGLDDIMRITWNPNTGKYLSNKILQHITDITAYYVGLTDYSETVDKWGFDHSEFDK